MVTLEQVEKLREYGNISYEEARAALEATNGDILQAIINLEKEGIIEAPTGGGYYSSKDSHHGNNTNYEEKEYNYQFTRKSTSFSEMLGGFLRWCGKILKKGNNNTFEVVKDGKNIIMVPVTVLALFLIFTFWITVPVLVVGLFFGYRYKFHGPDIEKTPVNKAMDSVASAAENLKKEVENYKDEKNGENSNHRR